LGFAGNIKSFRGPYVVHDWFIPIIGSRYPKLPVNGIYNNTDLKEKITLIHPDFLQLFLVQRRYEASADSSDNRQ
jgi:hypothetical protein